MEEKEDSRLTMKKDYNVTYTNGPLLYFNKDLSKKDYIEICNKLNHQFEETFQNKEYVFQPEPVSEGGLEMVKFPGKKESMYKSLRHPLRTKEHDEPEYKSQIITQNVMTEWLNDETIIIHQGLYSDTTLKAFYGAPIWTLEEIKIICNVLSDYGVHSSELPKKEDLSRAASKCT